MPNIALVAALLAGMGAMLFKVRGACSHLSVSSALTHSVAYV